MTIHIAVERNTQWFKSQQVTMPWGSAAGIVLDDGMGIHWIQVYNDFRV